MVMLGAQLDDLDGLAQRLRRTGDEIDAVRIEAQGTTTTVVEAVRGSIDRARGAIDVAMMDLIRSVGASAETAQATQWTGRNQEVFLGHHLDFQVAMDRAGSATTDAFAQFGQAVEQMAQALVDYDSSLAAALTDAAASSTSMAMAVDAQRQNLDQVMNAGIA